MGSKFWPRAKLVEINDIFSAVHLVIVISSSFKIYNITPPSLHSSDLSYRDSVTRGFMQPTFNFPAPAFKLLYHLHFIFLQSWLLHFNCGSCKHFTFQYFCLLHFIFSNFKLMHSIFYITFISYFYNLDSYISFVALVNILHSNTFVSYISYFPILNSCIQYFQF